MTDDSGRGDDDERYDLGVLLVHGIGHQARGQTLTAWADPVIRWLQVWLRRDPVEVGAAWPRRQPDANELDVGAERGWLDLYASHDPVANGAPFHLSSMPGKQLPLTSRPVVNFASPLRDHTGRAAGGQRRRSEAIGRRAVDLATSRADLLPLVDWSSDASVPPPASRGAGMLAIALAALAGYLLLAGLWRWWDARESAWTLRRQVARHWTVEFVSLLTGSGGCSCCLSGSAWPATSTGSARWPRPWCRPAPPG